MRPKAKDIVDRIVEIWNLVPSDAELKEAQNHVRNQIEVAINKAYGQGLKDAGTNYERLKNQIIDHAIACGIDLTNEPDDSTDTWLWILETVADQHKAMLKALEAIEEVRTQDDAYLADEARAEAFEKIGKHFDFESRTWVG